MDELKSEYRNLAKHFHPDCGGDAEIMKEINNQYERAFNAMNEKSSANADMNKESAAEFIAVMDALMKLHGIIVELCGSWLWISGNTLPVKEELKAAGCKWASKKKMWYWSPIEHFKIYGGKTSMSKIRQKYGSKILSKEENRQNVGYIGA